MKKIILGKINISLENIATGSGKITITGTKYGDFSYQWNAMGCRTIEQFLLEIDSHYFIKNVIGTASEFAFSPRHTFANLRRFIKNDLGYSHYREIEFQKELRKHLNSFQNQCNTNEDFVDGMDNFLYSLPYPNENVQEDFKALSFEPWHHIETNQSDLAAYLIKLFAKIQKEIKKA